MIEIEHQQILIKEKYINSEILEKYGFKQVGEQFRIDAPRFVMTIDKLNDIGILHVNSLAVLDLSYAVFPILFNMLADGVLMIGLSPSLVSESLYDSMIEYDRYVCGNDNYDY